MSGADKATAFSWTDEAVAELKRAIARGDSAGMIARGFCCSRSAVIGKAYRLRLRLNGHAHAQPTIKRQAPLASPAPAPVKVWQGNAIVAAPDVPMPDLRSAPQAVPSRPWTTRKAGECAWPVGDPMPGEEQHSCCAPVASRDGPGAVASYCLAHLKLRTSKGSYGVFAKSANELMRSLRRSMS